MDADGKVITARGPVDPGELGAVLMHEHLHSDIYDWERGELVTAEKPIAEERREFLVREAVPHMKACASRGCGAWLEATPAPWRAWPTFYAEVSEMTGLHAVLCTGFYREVEPGTYWVRTEADAIWPLVRTAPVEELADFCTAEITEGIRGTEVRAGAVKLPGADLEPHVGWGVDRRRGRWMRTVERFARAVLDDEVVGAGILVGDVELNHRL